MKYKYTHWLMFWTLAIVTVGCQSQTMTLIPANGIGLGYVLSGSLGFPLGKIIEIEGDFVEEPHSMASTPGFSSSVSVKAVNGIKLKEAVLVRIAEDGPKRNRRVGEQLRCRGYEWGRLGSFVVANEGFGRPLKEAKLHDEIQKMWLYFILVEEMPISMSPNKKPN